MALRMGAVLGGTLGSLREGFKEEREEALNVATQKIKILTELGLPKARARKEALRSKNELYDALSKDFSVPQIAVIMRQGKGQEVLDFVEGQRDLFGEAGVKPNDIVTISPDFKDTGLTKDMVLENVMGKINKGMSPTGAVNDTFGTSLTNRFGGNLGNVGKRQMQSIADATGVSISELQALASDDITKDPKLVEGTIRMFDPVKAEAAKKALEDTSGLMPTNTFNRTVRQHASNFSGAGSTLDLSNNLIYKPEQATRALQADRIAQEELAIYQKETGKGKFDNMDIKTIAGRIDDRLRKLNIYVGPDVGSNVTEKTKSITDTSDSANTGSSNPYTALGGGIPNIKTQVIRDAKGLVLPDGNPNTVEQTKILAQARIAIIADLKTKARPNQSDQDIANEAEEIIQEIRSKL